VNQSCSFGGGVVSTASGCGSARCK
jgi:hypothetical protein